MSIGVNIPTDQDLQDIQTELEIIKSEDYKYDINTVRNRIDHIYREINNYPNDKVEDRQLIDKILYEIEDTLDYFIEKYAYEQSEGLTIKDIKEKEEKEKHIGMDMKHTIINARQKEDDEKNIRKSTFKPRTVFDPTQKT